MSRKYALPVSIQMVSERISMLLQRFEPPFKVSELYRIQRGAFETSKDENVDYEAAITYLEKTDKIRILTRKEPFEETIFEPTEECGVPKPTLPIALPVAFKGKIASDAGMMLEAYAALYMLENKLRDFIEQKLKQAYGSAEWWEKGATTAVKKKVEERKQDKRVVWHHVVGGSPLMFTDFMDLTSIINANWNPAFKDTLSDLERVKALLTELEVPRNIIAHCNPLTTDEKTRFLQNATTLLKIIGV